VKNAITAALAGRTSISVRWWWAAIVGLVGLLALSAGLGWELLRSVDPTAPAPVTFIVPKNQPVGRVAERLADQHLIRHPLALRAWLKLTGLDSQLQAGSFQLSASMSLPALAEALTSLANPTDIWVTVLEGWRREEIAQHLDGLQLEEFDSFEFLQLSRDDEGRLFPDTYLVPKESTARDIHRLLTDTFERKVTTQLAAELAASPHDLETVLIMASLVEREGRGDQQLRQVAGILFNRLELGMPLQVDATLQYASGYDQAQNSWWQPPTNADRQLDSPFNTYLHPGLPPQPIANPGLAAITAVLDPAETEYLFYLHDDRGTIHYAINFARHQENIRNYLR